MAGLATISKQIGQLERDVMSLQNRPEKPAPKDLSGALETLGKRFVIVEKGLKALQDTDPIEIPDIEEKLKKLRQDLITMISSLPHGGNANRNIQASGVNVLQPFTDINFIPGTNVSFSIVPNQQTKYTDWTINATGGSGSGITRLIQSVAVDTVMGSALTVDYVYLVSGTTTMSLPTAVGNSNLYTVKNVGTGVVTINTTGGQTIDNDPTVVMPVRYTSVDVESDSANWNIT